MTTTQQNAKRKSAVASESSASDPSGADWNGLKDDVGGLAEAAVERGWGFVDSARTQALDYADRRKEEAAASVGGFAQAVRQSGEAFGEIPNIQAVLDSAADGLDQLSSSIRDRSFIELYEEAESFARRSPLAVAAVGSVAGLLIARLLKASAETAADRRSQAVDRRTPSRKVKTAASARPAASR